MPNNFLQPISIIAPGNGNGLRFVSSLGKALSISITDATQSNYTIVLPPAAPTVAGQALTANIDGTMSWGPGFDPAKVIALTNTLDSGTTSSGALTVAGGVGIGATLRVGGNIWITSGASSVGYQLSGGANAAAFGYAGTAGAYFSNAAVGDFIVRSSSVLRLGVGAAVSNLDLLANGVVVINSTTDASSAMTNASLQVRGGINASKSIWSGAVGSTDGAMVIQASSGTAVLRFASSGTANYIQSGSSTGGGSLAPLYFTGYSTGANPLMSISATGMVSVGVNATGTVAPTSGQYFNVSSSTYTDNATVASGTAVAFNATYFAPSTLAATNATITTTNASTVYIAGPPVAGTNQTLRNAYALNVGSGTSSFASVTSGTEAIIDTLGANEAQLVYPPTGNAVLTGNNVTVTNLPYGNGTYYIASSTNAGGFPAWLGFQDKVAGNGWSSLQIYNATTGVYQGSRSTADITTGTPYLGEIIEVALPAPKYVTQVVMYPRTGNTPMAPKTFVIMGSNTTNSNYRVIYNQPTALTWVESTSQIFTLTTPGMYNLIRIVVLSITSGGYAQFTFSLRASNPTLTLSNTTAVASGVNTPLFGALNVSGDVVLAPSNPKLFFPASSLSAPTAVTRSTGARIVLSPGITSTLADHAIGVDTNTVWYGTQGITDTHKWYAGNLNTMSLTGAGNLTILGTIQSPSLVLANSTSVFYEDAMLQSMNAVPSITLTGTATYVSGSTAPDYSYFLLTSGGSGQASYQVNPGTFFTAEFEMQYTGGSDGVSFCFYQTSRPAGDCYANGDGYAVTLSAYMNAIVITPPGVAGARVGTTKAVNTGAFGGTSTFSSVIAMGTWVPVSITYRNGYLAVYVNGTLVNSVRTTVPAVAGDLTTYVGFAGYAQVGSTYSIRNMRLTKNVGFANVQGSGNLTYNNGTVAIASNQDSTLLGTGALQVAGGVSVGKWLTFNGGGFAELGSSATGGLSFEFFSGGGYRHWVRSRHDAAGVTVGNAIDFYLNTATTAAGSSGVGTGNVLGLSVSATGVNVPTVLQVMGGTGVFRTASSISDYTLIGTNPTDGTANTRIVISGNTRASPSAGNIEYIATNTGQHVFTTQGTLVTFSITAAGTVNIPVATTLGGTVNPTGATGGALNIAGDVVLGATNPRIYFPINGVGPPSVATRSSGTKLVLYPSLGANSVDYALGIEANVLWYSVPDSTCSHKWYAGATTLMTLSGTGNLSVSGTGTIASNLTVGGYAMVGTTGGASSTVPNMIGFSGTFGESSTPASMHTALVERIYSGAEGSELLIFKGNDVTGASGPDVVRIAAAEFYFDALTVAGSYNYSTNTVPSVARKLSVTLTSASLTVPLTVTTGGGVVSSFVNSTSATSQTSITVQNTVNGTTGYFGLDGSGLQAFTQDALTLFVNNGKPIQLLTSANIQTNAPIIMTNNTLFGPPTFNTRSVGTKIVLWGGGVNSSSAEFALGIEASTLWSSVPETSSMFKWYGGTALVATLTGTGSLNLAGSEISLNSAENRVKLNSTGNAIWLCSVPGDAAGDFHLFDASGSGRILGWYRSTNVLALGAVNASTAVQVPGTLTIGGGAVITSPASGDGYNGNTLTLQSRAESSKYYLSFSGRVLSGGVVGWDITMANSAVTYSVMTFDRGNVTIPSALTVGGNMAMTGTAPSISGNGTTGPLSIDPNYTTNNYVRIFDRLSVAGTLDVTGDYINLGTANVPVGLVHEVGGNTPLLDMNVNYFPAAVGTVNTTYGGAMFRIDGRQGTTGTPIFQWATRASGSSSGITAASLDVAGNMTHYGNVAVGAGQNVGSLTLGNAGSTGGGVISSDPAHCLYYRYNYAGGINKMAMYSSGDIEFYNNGVIASQTLKMSIAASGLVSIAGPLTVSGTATLNGSVSIGNAPLSYAKLSLLGTHQSTNAGPHITAYTSADTTYPVSQVFNWSHDNVALLFDAYWNNSFISCHAGSSAQIYKIANFLKFNWGVASVGSVVPFNTALAINLANGAVAVSGPTLTVPTPVNPTDAATKAYVDGRAGTPTGSIVMYATSSAPTGWLLCDGAAVSRSTYSQLFAVVGTTYGGGDGSSTFNVPSFVNRFPVGAGSSYGNNSKGGTPDSTLVAHSHSYSGSTSYDTSPNHTHDMYLGRNFTETVSGSAGFGIGNFLPQSGRGNAEAYTSTNGSGSYGHSHSFSGATTQVGSSASGANLPPYIGIQFIIKT